MNKRIPIIISILLVLISLWLLISPPTLLRKVLLRLDNMSYDLTLHSKVFYRPKKPSGSVVIVDIDDKSLAAVGRWPWPRQQFAELTNTIEKDGAAVVAFDILFAEKEDNLVNRLITVLENEKRDASLISSLRPYANLFDGDQLFAKSIQRFDAILAIGLLPIDVHQNTLPDPLIKLTLTDLSQLSIVKAKGYIGNIAVIQQAAKGAGFINIFADGDGIIRRAPLVMSYNGGLYPSLALRAVMQFYGESISLVTPYYDQERKIEGVQIGERIIPTDVKGQVLIPFLGPSYTFIHYSAIDVLKNKLPKDALLGKIVFVGSSATGLGDLIATAIQTPFPGVEVQASLADGIITNAFSAKPAWLLGANVLTTILLGFIAAILFTFVGKRTLWGIILVIPIVAYVFKNWLWDNHGLVLSFLMPLLLIRVIAFVNTRFHVAAEKRKRMRLSKLYGENVSERFIDKMLRVTGDFGAAGEKREMTVMFAELKHFHEQTLKKVPTEIVKTLSNYFTPMTEIIYSYSGSIDKYNESQISAFWNAPLINKQHIKHSLLAALKMQVHFHMMRPRLVQDGWPDLQFAISLNCGMVFLGNMGSKYHTNYTVLGEPLDFAKHCLDLSSLYGVEIIVSESIATAQPKFAFRLLDKIRYNGQVAAIYELISTKSQLTKLKRDQIAQFEKALKHYFAAEFDQAKRIINELYQSDQTNTLYRLYQERIELYEKTPPPANWDGAF